MKRIGGARCHLARLLFCETRAAKEVFYFEVLLSFESAKTLKKIVKISLCSSSLKKKCYKSKFTIIVLVSIERQEGNFLSSSLLSRAKRARGFSFSLLLSLRVCRLVLQARVSIAKSGGTRLCVFGCGLCSRVAKSKTRLCARSFLCDILSLFLCFSLSFSPK